MNLQGGGRAPEDAAEREQEEPDLVGRLSQRAAQAAAKLAVEKGEIDSLAYYGSACLHWNEKKSSRCKDMVALFVGF